MYTEEQNETNLTYCYTLMVSPIMLSIVFKHSHTPLLNYKSETINSI